jgi:hypothetical protein
MRVGKVPPSRDRMSFRPPDPRKAGRKINGGRSEVTRRVFLVPRGEPFELSVHRAIETILDMGLALKHLTAQVEGRVVTLSGVVGCRETRIRVIREFNQLIKTEETISDIRVDEIEPVAGPALPTDKMKRAEALSEIAKEYYGKAVLYPRIFNADRDILDDPRLIRRGNELRKE